MRQDPSLLRLTLHRETASPSPLNFDLRAHEQKEAFWAAVGVRERPDGSTLRPAPSPEIPFTG